MSRSTSSVAFASTRTTPRRHLLPSSSSLSPFVRNSSSSSSQETDSTSNPPWKDDHDPNPTPSQGSKVSSSYRALVLKQQLEEDKFFSRQTNELAKSLPPPKPNRRPSLPPSSPSPRSQWKLSSYNSYGNLITSSPSASSSSSSSRLHSPRTSLSTPRAPLDLPPRQLPSPSSGQFLRSVTPVYGSKRDKPLPSTFDDAEGDYVRDYGLRVQARLIQDLPMSLRPPNPFSPSALDLSPTPPPLDPPGSSLDHPKPSTASEEAAILARRYKGKAKADFDASRIYEMNEVDLFDASESLKRKWTDTKTYPERLQAICIRYVSLGLPHLAIGLLKNFRPREPGYLFLAPASSLHRHPPWFIRDVLSSHTSLLLPSPLSHRTPPSSKSQFNTSSSVKTLADFLSRLGQIDSAIFPGDPVVVALALRAFDAFLRGPMEATEGKKRKLAEFNFQKIVGLITKPDFHWSMGGTFSLGQHGKEDLEISLAGLPEEVRGLPIWKTVRMVPPRRILQDLIDLHRPPSPSQPDLILDDATPSSFPPSSHPPTPSERSTPPPPPPPPPSLSYETIRSLLSSLPFPVRDDPILTLQTLELFSLTFPSEGGKHSFDRLLRQARRSPPSRWEHRPAPALSLPLPPSSSSSPLDPSAPSPPPPAVVPSWQLALSTHQAMTDPGGPSYDQAKATLERLSPLFSRNEAGLWKAYLDANDPESWEARRLEAEEEWAGVMRRREEDDRKRRELKEEEERTPTPTPAKEDSKPKETAMGRLRRTLSVGLEVKR